MIGFAARAWREQASLYLLVALAAFAVYAAVEYLVPQADIKSPQGQFKVFLLDFTELFADAFLVTVVTLGVAARTTGKTLATRALLGAAIERWLPVILVGFCAQYAFTLVEPLSWLGDTDVPRGVLLFSAPLTWILYGILSLTQPFVALSANRGILSVALGFGYAFSVSLRRTNLLRVCLLGAISILPSVMGLALSAALTARHVQRGFFFSNFPLDALLTGPLAALQTAFALDFARRAGRTGVLPPPPG